MKICFVGLDGSGKSTQSNVIVRKPELLDVCTLLKVNWLAPFTYLMFPLDPLFVATDQHEPRPRNPQPIGDTI